ncbi:hypothetical protein AB0R12_34640, partial [Streptomyces niveus]
ASGKDGADKPSNWTNLTTANPHLKFYNGRRGDADGTLALVLLPEAAPADAVRRIAGALAAHDVLRARLVRGLDLALLPAGATPPGEPLFVRERPVSERPVPDQP